MTYRMLAVTRADQKRLQALLQSGYALAIGGGRSHLAELQDALSHALVLESQEVLPDVMTMNSTVKLLDLDRNEFDTFTLVYPDEACIAEGKLSILSPLGAELFGRRAGESFSLRLQQREIRKRVERVTFQPERVGAFEL